MAFVRSCLSRFTPIKSCALQKITCNECKYKFCSAFLSQENPFSSKLRDRTFPSTDQRVITCPKCLSQSFTVEKMAGYDSVEEFIESLEPYTGQGLIWMEWCHVKKLQPKPRNPCKWHYPRRNMVTFICTQCNEDRDGSDKCPRDRQPGALTSPM
eukprot:m.88719 g.88719  ORF g.88719 m.88719 type:complete len:155 (+) comp36586_c1_seq17:1003-1467(+)